MDARIDRAVAGLVCEGPPESGHRQVDPLRPEELRYNWLKAVADA